MSPPKGKMQDVGFGFAGIGGPLDGCPLMEKAGFPWENPLSFFFDWNRTGQVFGC